MLVLLAVQLAGAFLDLVKGTAREDAVFVVTVIFEDVEIYGSVALICLAGIKNLLDEGNLFDNVAGSPRFD